MGEQRNQSIPEILLVDDDPSAVHMMARVLAAEGTLRFATSGPDALALARSVRPDLILLDAEMPGMSGLEVCAALKADPVLQDIPVIFVSSHRDEAFEVAGFAAGAADFIGKPYVPQLVTVRVRSQLRSKRMADELRRHATTDALTGVANRRLLDEVLGREWLRAYRSGSPLALVLVDIDHFKLFNDHYGHPAGDACLRAVAGALHGSCMRPADLAARYGGEEFALLLPDTDRKGAENVAKRLLESVALLMIPHLASPLAPWVTVSAGIACHDASSGGSVPPHSRARSVEREDAVQLVQVADVALYRAKTGGRAQVCVVDVREKETGELYGDEAASMTSKRRSG